MIVLKKILIYVINNWYFSKEDEDIVFCSKDECASYEENWQCKEAHSFQGHHEPHCERQSSWSFSGNNRVAKKRLAASEKENNYFHKGQKPPLIEKLKSNVLPKKISNRLIAPTVTSLAKSGNLDVREKPKPYVPKPNPDQAVRFIKFFQFRMQSQFY